MPATRTSAPAQRGGRLVELEARPAPDDWPVVWGVVGADEYRRTVIEKGSDARVPAASPSSAGRLTGCFGWRPTEVAARVLRRARRATTVTRPSPTRSTARAQRRIPAPRRRRHELLARRRRQRRSRRRRGRLPRDRTRSARPLLARCADPRARRCLQRSVPDRPLREHGRPSRPSRHRDVGQARLPMSIHLRTVPGGSRSARARRSGFRAGDAVRDPHGVPP